MSRLDDDTLDAEFALCVANLKSAQYRLRRRVDAIRESADDAERNGMTDYAAGMRAAARMLGGEP